MIYERISLGHTNIPSETVKLRPDSRVTTWISAQPNPTLFISAITIGELRRGFVTLPPSEVVRRNRLEQWLGQDVLLWFNGRILPVTKENRRSVGGVIDGTCQLHGTPANTADGLIAATAVEHGLTVVTRNVRDFACFAPFGIPIFNPWENP